MRIAAPILIFLAATACHQVTPKSEHVARSEMRTIDNVAPAPVVNDPPPMLSDEAPAPKPKDAMAAEKAIPLTEADEQVRARLPFAPAIAMDPVDGSKISIRANTPTTEYKNHIYYFSSDANKRTFLANPDTFMKGVFALPR